VRRAYADAKAAYDRNDPNAAELFDRVLRLLDAVEPSSLATLSDVRTIAIGFRDLSEARLARAAPSPPPAAPRAVSSATNDAPPSSATARVYYAGEPNVVPPVALAQALPAWTPPGATRRQWSWDGALEVLVSETGDVVSARLQSPIYPTYDQQLLQAALSWKYKPALRNGIPVKFMKVVRVRLAN
jgi:outer membrane biosynthesis protein TonB